MFTHTVSRSLFSHASQCSHVVFKRVLQETRLRRLEKTRIPKKVTIESRLSLSFILSNRTNDIKGEPVTCFSHNYGVVDQHCSCPCTPKYIASFISHVRTTHYYRRPRPRHLISSEMSSQSTQLWSVETVERTLGPDAKAPAYSSGVEYK